MANQQSMGGSVNGMAPRGSRISIPPIIPTSSNGGALKMTLRKDENQKLFIHSSPSASPSTSSTAIAPMEKEQRQSISHAPPSTTTLIEQQKQSTVVPPSNGTCTESTGQQPLAPPTAAVENGQETEKEEGGMSMKNPRPISNGSTFGGMTNSPLFSSSPQLLWRGPDGFQPIPLVVYVEHTENGFVQVRGKGGGRRERGVMNGY